MRTSSRTVTVRSITGPVGQVPTVTALSAIARWTRGPGSPACRSPILSQIEEPPFPVNPLRAWRQASPKGRNPAPEEKSRSGAQRGLFRRTNSVGKPEFTDGYVVKPETAVTCLNSARNQLGEHLVHVPGD